MKGIRTQINKSSDFANINKWVVVCLILHNMLICFNEIWVDEDIEDDNAEDIAPEELINIVNNEEFSGIIHKFNQVINSFFDKQTQIRFCIFIVNSCSYESFSFQLKLYMLTKIYYYYY